MNQLGYQGPDDPPARKAKGKSNAVRPLSPAAILLETSETSSSPSPSRCRDSLPYPTVTRGRGRAHARHAHDRWACDPRPHVRSRVIVTVLKRMVSRFSSVPRILFNYSTFNSPFGCLAARGNFVFGANHVVVRMHADRSSHDCRRHTCGQRAGRAPHIGGQTRSCRVYS